MAFIECEKLNFSYPYAGDKSNVFALHDINFSLEQGNLLLVCGTSGSGKSTLLRLLKPEISPNGRLDGGIIYAGKSLNDLPKTASAAEIGYVFQDPNAAYVTEKVYSELAFLPQNLGLSPETIELRIAEICAFFGLESIIGSDICNLSGGQKQLVNLAAVMTAYPKLLILDEPTSQLDPISAERFCDMVLRIRREMGITIIVSEHNTEHFFNFADKILYLENGHQLAFDDPSLFVKKAENHDFLPTSAKFFSLLDLADHPAFTTSSAMNFVRDHYKKAVCDQFIESKNHLNGDAVKVENVYFSYTRRGKDVIDGLDFNADFGRIHAICGANGSGKTTLFKLISGLKTSRDGKIIIDGKRISSYKSGALYRNLIAALPQDPHDIFICESVKEDISTSRDGEKYDLKTLRSLCKRLNVSEKLLDLHPYDLSGGEIQRAALVKLLLLEPKILLLDEPTKGLDKQCKRQLSALLKELAAEGKAVIFITHDMDFIAETADDVTLIFGGKAVSSLPVREFIMQNSVYTTAASRIGRGYFDKTMTDSELISSAVSRKNERGDGDE